MSEMVDHPSHYRPGTYEAIKVIDAWGLGFSLGSVVKYICRMGRKPGAAELEDLKKMRWYIDHEIQRIEAEQRGGDGTQPEVERA